MAFQYYDRQLLVAIHEHQRKMERMLVIMGAGMDALIAAVDHNANATDSLSDEVAQAVDWIKNHNADNDPALAALAVRLEEKNAKAVKAKEDLDAATSVVEASGGAATP